jgi:tryptophan-rich sensory protein
MTYLRNWQAALLSIASVLAAALIGQFATFPNLQSWYAQLAKPSFNPPNWIFGPVWTLLFALMALSLWRVLRDKRPWADKRAAVGAFYLQLALNALWPVIFFAWHSPIGGLIDIVPQWLAVVATIWLAGRIDRLAGVCLVPLAAWVGFAGVLNFAIWQLNR